jgi:hypothetical protein
MLNLFGSLDIEIWDFIEICLPAVLLAGCLKFDISEYFLKAFQPGTLNLEPISFCKEVRPV